MTFTIDALWAGGCIGFITGVIVILCLGTIFNEVQRRKGKG